MFRELQRKNKQLSQEECIRILKTEKRGVLSVIGDGDYPYGMPMNHFYNVDDGNLYFHCGRHGHRLDALKKNNKVSFCVYDGGEKNSSDWALNIKSVIVFGKAETIDDAAKTAEISQKLSRKFTDDEDYIKNEIESFLSETLLIKILIEHISGKKVTES